MDTIKKEIRRVFKKEVEKRKKPKEGAVRGRQTE